MTVSPDFPPGGWGIVTGSLDRIENVVRGHTAEMRGLRDEVIRLQERQAGSASQSDLALVRAEAQSLHLRVDGHEADLTALNTTLSALRLSWAKAGGFAAGGGGLGAAIVVAITKGLGIQ